MQVPEDSWVMLSALEHWSYCPRQCGLIHLEQTFTDNVYTVRGHHAHERTHEESTEAQGDVRVARSMPLWSHTLGLTGRADVVEFRGDQPYPIEYKVGRMRQWGHEAIQLGGQAMCLEEMLGVSVPEGAIFYRGSQRRRPVVIDEELRTLVQQATLAVRAMMEETSLPPPLNDARCPKCSLFDACLPDVVARPRRLQLLHTALFRVDDKRSDELELMDEE